LGIDRRKTLSQRDVRRVATEVRDPERGILDEAASREVARDVRAHLALRVDGSIAIEFAS
jgi:hypothetical protein